MRCGWIAICECSHTVAPRNVPTHHPFPGSLAVAHSSSCCLLPPPSTHRTAGYTILFQRNKTTHHHPSPAPAPAGSGATPSPPLGNAHPGARSASPLPCRHPFPCFRQSRSSGRVRTKIRPRAPRPSLGSAPPPLQPPEGTGGTGRRAQGVPC